MKTAVSTRFFCPNCGQKRVFMIDDGGDVYLEETHYCLACLHHFYLPHGTYPSDPKEGIESEAIHACRCAEVRQPGFPKTFPDELS